MYNHPHHTCLHPHKVINQYTGEVLLVPCGSCSACLLNSQIKAATLCDIECSKHKFVYFVTLTYSSDFVPIFSLKMDLVDGRKYSNGDVLVHYKCETPRLKKYYEDELLNVVTSKDMFLCNDLLFSRTKTINSLYMLSKIDLQLFLKRLRKNLTKFTDEKIRYYAVGEYGPQTFRPHYHLLLFFDSPQTQQALSFCISQAWKARTDNNGFRSVAPRKIGRIDIQLVSGSASSYVAGYVAGNANLPRFHKVRSLRPFSLHSSFFGWPDTETAQEEVYELQPREFMERSYSSNGKVRTILAPFSLEHRYFPKTYRFFSADVDELYNYYSLYEQVSKFLPSSDFSSEEIVTCLYDLSQDKYKSSLHGLRYICGLTWQQIYSIYQISKHFVRFCCSGNPNLIPLRFQQIIQYYRYKRLFQLSKFYEKMQDYYQSSSLAQVADTIDFWFDFVIKNKGIRPIVRSNKYNHWSYLNYKRYCDEELQKHTKHKYFNDLNKIFV